MTESRFVGVGVSHYDGPWNDLAHPVPEVQEFAALLGDRFSRTILTDPSEDEARRAFRQLRESMLDGGCLVVLWSGHGIPSGEVAARLLHDTPPTSTDDSPEDKDEPEAEEAP